MGRFYNPESEVKTVGITLEQAKKHLEIWLEAEAEIASSQSYTMGTRSLTRANLKEVREEIRFWQSKVSQLENARAGRGRNRVYRAVMIDN